MLGIDYGTQKFLFEKGILEGSSLPFSIKLNFHYLYWIVPILCFVTLCIIGFLSKNSLFYILIFSLFVFVILICLYIYWILDLNENFSLIIFRKIFTLLRIKFVDNFEHILYRAKLSVYESKRQQIDLNILKQMLINIEDKRFYQHKGVDWKATSRALLCRGRKIPLIKKYLISKQYLFLVALLSLNSFLEPCLLKIWIKKYG